MSNEDHEAPSKVPRRLIAGGVLAILLLIASVAALVTREDGVGLTRTTVSSSSIGTAATNTKVDTRTAVVERLKDILRIRDRAFQNRDAQILEDVYTVDCPCLEGDRNAIQELVANNYHVVGGATSIRVHRVDKVNGRLWLVVADFRSAPLRIVAEDKRLIREEPAGNDLFQFALSKPVGAVEWLLGRATAYKESSG